MVRKIMFTIYGADRVNLSDPLFSNIENISLYTAFQKDARTVLSVICGTVAILGSIGNFLVITTILHERQMRLKATYIFIGSLAISDIFFLLISLPIQMVAPMLDRWPLGNIWCKTVFYFEHLNGLNSVFTLMGLSADRLFGTLYPLKSTRVRSQRYGIAVCSLIWVISALTSTTNLSSISIALIPTLDNSTVTYCLYDAESTELRTKTIAMFLYGYLLPLTVLVAIYYVILSHLVKQLSTSIRTFSSKSQRDKVRWTQRRKVTILACSIVAMFFICWLPFHVVGILRDVLEIPVTVTLATVFFVGQILIYANSALNPILYAFISEDFQKGFKRRFHFKCDSKSF